MTYRQSRYSRGATRDSSHQPNRPLPARVHHLPLLLVDVVHEHDDPGTTYEAGKEWETVLHVHNAVRAMQQGVPAARAGTR